MLDLPLSVRLQPFFQQSVVIHLPTSAMRGAWCESLRGGFQRIRFFVSFLLQVGKYLLLLGTCRNLLDTYRLIQVIDYVRNKRNMFVSQFRILRGWRCQTFSTNNMTSCVCFWVPNPRILGSTWCSPATTKLMGWCDLPANVCIHP